MLKKNEIDFKEEYVFTFFDGIIQWEWYDISVLCTLWIFCVNYSTNISGALHRFPKANLLKKDGAVIPAAPLTFDHLCIQFPAIYLSRIFFRLKQRIDV